MKLQGRDVLIKNMVAHAGIRSEDDAVGETALQGGLRPFRSPCPV